MVDLIERAEQACLTMEAGGTAPARSIIRELAAALKAAEAELSTMYEDRNRRILRAKEAEADLTAARAWIAELELQMRFCADNIAGCIDGTDLPSMVIRDRTRALLLGEQADRKAT